MARALSSFPVLVLQKNLLHKWHRLFELNMPVVFPVAQPTAVKKA